jgi:hypothetical protein
MINTTIIQKGTRAVAINQQDALVWANLYVNVLTDGDVRDATITPTRWQGKTVKGAERWATKQLER